MIELLATTRMSLQVIPASPIQRLTFDVLWHMFSYVSIIDPLKGPITVSHVSQHWRLVALNSPFIWSNITIRLSANTDNTGTGSPRQHLLASAYFKLSQNVPIALSINATRAFETWEQKELFQPHAHRLRSLHIKAIEGSVANLLWMQMGMNMPMPRLEVFDTVISDFSRIRIKTASTIQVMTEENKIIPPVFDSLVFWDLWNPSGLTALTLETACLWNKPDLDDIYHILATTCQTLQHLTYQGLIGSLDDDEVSTGRSPLEFPELRSLTVLCNDDMVPFLQLMIIPTLDSLMIHDFLTYPTTTPATSPATDEMDVDHFTFDPNDLFVVIKQWPSITNLEIYGLDVSPDHIMPEMLKYLKALNQLSTLVLYGSGVATSIAHTLFTHKEPLLPNISCFLLGISEAEMKTNDSDDLCNFLITRRHHQLPRLQKLSINSNYFRYINNMNRVGVLWESGDDIFVFADPTANRFIPLEEVNLKLLRAEVQI